MGRKSVRMRVDADFAEAVKIVRQTTEEIRKIKIFNSDITKHLTPVVIDITKRLKNDNKK